MSVLNLLYLKSYINMKSKIVICFVFFLLLGTSGLYAQNASKSGTKSTKSLVKGEAGTPADARSERAAFKQEKPIPNMIVEKEINARSTRTAPPSDVVSKKSPGYVPSTEVTTKKEKVDLPADSFFKRKKRTIRRLKPAMSRAEWLKSKKSE